jgi:hypothetical protein
MKLRGVLLSALIVTLLMTNATNFRRGFMESNGRGNGPDNAAIVILHEPIPD